MALPSVARPAAKPLATNMKNYKPQQIIPERIRQKIALAKELLFAEIDNKRQQT
jgi:hypothetical protein